MRKLLFCALALAASVSATALAASPRTAIRYSFSERYDLDIWTGPSSNPIQAYGGNGGTIDVSVARNTNGTYDVRQRVRDANGAESLESIYRLVRDGNQTLEALDAQAGTYRSTGTVRRMNDTYPFRRVMFALPLLPREGWDAATREVTTVSIVLTSPSPNTEQDTIDRAADGAYDAQSKASNFSSTTDVRLFDASTYELSKTGYNTLSQTFALPRNGVIDVTSSGTPPLPIKRGTVKIKSWYPYNGGKLTHPLLRDRFHVLGSRKIPAQCKRRANETATRVDEEGYAVDPVQGTASAFIAAYFLTPLSKGTLMIACVEEQYVAGVWANAWAMSAGDWGKLTLEESGARLYVARDVSTGAAATARLAGLPVVGLDAIAMRRILGIQGPSDQ